ncbi:MAG: DUF4136 domain-containing protein [Sphingorhabdus sp.]
MLKNIIRFALPLSALSLAACATPFRADVSRFQELPAPQGQSFVVRAADAPDQGGIEFGQYAALVANEMQELGYVAAPTGSAADMTVTLDYGVDEGRERTVVRQDPFYDPYWGYGSFYRPYVIHTRRGARYVMGYYDPFLYSGFNRAYDVDSYTVYTSGLDLKINRNADGKRLFEGKAEAKSRSNKLPYLVPNLVEAMFTGFPGNSGETVRISVAPEEKK